RDLGGEEGLHAVTMTGELSQLFRTKREGVAFVLDAVVAAFPGADVHVWGVDGRWRTPEEARGDPLAVAAANWAATARIVGRSFADCLLLDTGSTTTHGIRIVGGEPVDAGATTPLPRPPRTGLPRRASWAAPSPTVCCSTPARRRRT